VQFEISSAHEMHEFGLRLAKYLKAGDYLVLNGELGAGKTTFTQGLGIGLNVVGNVTSPTFVISRIHRSNGTGPELIHVDAYRLTSRDQLLDLGLDEHPNSVIVMEWGASYISALTETWLQIDISRTSEVDISQMNLTDPAAGVRIVELTAIGDRWENLDLAGLK
jgi:tRNA threonylcarbamoyladenosine biosynthesis protein TsaE